MDNIQRLVITGLLILSFVFIFAPIIITFIRSRALNRKKSEIGTVLCISAFLILSIWCIRYAVGYYAIVSHDSQQNLTAVEEALNCFLTTLRIFGIDENYAEYVAGLKTMFRGIVPHDHLLFGLAQGLLIFYASLQNVIAPVVGGAVIFEILASIFPKIRMALSYVEKQRKKYFFSELNEASLELAKGIVAAGNQHFKKPVIIFTDVYTDDDEKKSELLTEAKSIGAICVKDDIAHVRKNKYGERAFLLIDESESGNLQALTDLSDRINNSYIKNSEIFFVANSDAYIEIEQRIYDRLKCEFNFVDDELPTFIPVQGYRNLVSDLLVEIPLFEPLIDKKDKSSLTVTILGTGHIGTEMFLTTYWMGQILNCTLNINIVSAETEESFWSKIDYINPEIRRTTKADDPILRINRKGDMADPYCNVNYINCDAKSSHFLACLDESTESEHVIDTDYFFVSLGSDELNISVANTIKNAVGKYHISQEDISRTVIAYVVYDPTISEVLNRKKLFSFSGGTADILMCAVGSLDNVYSAKNVFLIDHESAANKMHDAYLSAQGYETRAKIHKKRIRDDYKHWANLARGMHIKYKMFSMGVYYDSVFNFDCLNAGLYVRSVETALDKYKQIVSGQTEFKKTEDAEKHVRMLHEMAWLEHRRWNAFTRVKGFKHTDDYDAYAVSGQIGSYKQMELKLHPCLVECDKKGIRAQINHDGKINEATLLKCQDRSDFDLLDDLSYDLKDKGYNDYDFKLYDYPVSDF